MAATHRVDQDLLILRNDATKVMQDISRLTRQLRAVGSEKIDETGGEIKGSIQEEIKVLQRRMADLNAQMKIYAQRVDKHVRENPYVYVAGGLGVGYLFGKLFLARRS